MNIESAVITPPKSVLRVARVSVSPSDLFNPMREEDNVLHDGYRLMEMMPLTCKGSRSMRFDVFVFS